MLITRISALKGLVAVVILIFSIAEAEAQAKYWVYFKSKTNPGVDPATYIDIHSLQRRMAAGVKIYDSTDWPVNGDFVTEIKSLGIQTGYQSRWLNAVAISANRQLLDKVWALPFVKDIQPMQYFAAKPASAGNEVPAAVDEELLESQLRCMQGSEFITRGINGKGIRIAVFDGGFPGVDTNPIFDHLRENHQIVKTYDFVKKKDFVYDYMSHGTAVLSCITGIFDGKNMGLATGAEFLLARTEIKPEVKVEEEYWMAAMEWADANGADIISSSLGYTDKRYTVKQMNGRSTLVSQAAAMAARKGILVINAMGNDGRESWEVMGAPADVDSVLSIGGIDPGTGYHINFSSFGPTSDYRMKPNVCAPGVAMIASPSSIKKGYGTSYSTPLVSGFAACVWQMNRDKTSMEIFRLIEQSGHLYPYFDYAHGYGIPQASFFFGGKKTFAESQIKLERELDAVKVSVTDISKSDEKYMNYLYYHIQNAQGTLVHYAVLDVSEDDVVSIPLSKLTSGCTLRVYYKGSISEMKF